MYYGLSSAALTNQVAIASPATTQASVEQLTAGTWYFAISDFNSAGVESAKSAVVNLVVHQVSKETPGPARISITIG